MLSYETILFNKLKAALMADQPGTFVHGQQGNRRRYDMLSFGRADQLAYSELRYDSRTRRWDTASPYGVLRGTSRPDHCG